MDESTLRQICKILEIPDAAINNNQPLTPPQLAGAGRVKPFREDRKLPFSSRPLPGRNEGLGHMENPEPISTNKEVSRSLPSASQKTRLWETWPPYPTYDEFEITADEIKRRAAWSWYRTGIICAKSANIQSKDATRSNQKKLFRKSERAKSHALLLYPKLLDEGQIESPSWADPFTSYDKDYYLEMERNREYHARSEMAELYKRSAREYMLEALYPFLEDKQTEEIKLTHAEPKEIHEYLEQVIEQDNYGCLSRLWDEAISWDRTRQEVAKAQGHHLVTEVPTRDDVFERWRPEKFDLWWTRAAQARGHADWLLRERRESELVGHSAPIETWRILPPGTVGNYDNSCVIFSFSAALAFCSDYRIDAFGTEFNISSEQVRGWQSGEFGWPYHSFVYGAPEFVYHALGTDSTTSLIGLLPTDNASSHHGLFLNSISVYDRYIRRGISNTLDASSPEHYRTLARCADDILADLDAEGMLESLIIPKYRDSSILSLLLAALQSILDKRLHMTAQEAEDQNFEDVTFACINFFIRKIQHMLFRPPGLNEHRYLILVEHEVSKLLSPWYDFRIHQTRGGRLIVSLKSLLSRRTMVDTSMSEHMINANPIWACYEAAVISALDEFLETVRQLVVGNLVLPHQTYHFILPFKDYLETGDATKMPVVQGSLTNRKELTKLGLYKSGRFKCKPGCQCPLPKLIQELEKSMCHRVSDHPEAKEQRRAIREFFSLNAILAKHQNENMMVITPERMKLLLRVRKPEGGLP